MKKDWTYKKLGEVAEIIMGQSPAGSSLNENKGIEFHQGKVAFGEKYLQHSSCFTNKPTKLTEGNSLLLCVRAPVGILNMTDRKICIGRGLCAITAKEITDTNYLYYVLKSKQSYFEKNATGSTFKAISSAIVKDTTIPIPPLAIQRSIVSELDLLHSVIEKKQEQLRELDNLAQSLFYQMFGDPITNPMGWEIKKLGEVASKIGSGATPKGGNESYKDEGISLIRSLNVYNNFFTYKDLAHIDDAQANELKNVIVCANDVLMNITGASVARCCIVPNDVLPARVNQHVAIIRLKDDISYVFMHRQLTSIEYQEKLLLISRGSGATREALTKGQLEQLNIIHPPLSLQQSFAAKVSAIEAQKQAITQSIQHTEALLAQRMDNYFG